MRVKLSHKHGVILAVTFALVTATGCLHSPQEKEAKFMESGRKYMAKKDYARAILQFRNAVQAMPRDPEAHYQFALANLEAGRLTDAVNALRKATALNPGHSNAQVKLAELMAQSGIKDVVEEAGKRAEEVLRSSPDNVDALDVLGLSELQRGDLDDAQKHLEQALDKVPQNLKSSVVLAKVHVMRHDLKAAESVLAKAVQAAPESSEAAGALGQLYLLAGRWADAERQFQNALKENPQYALALMGLASAEKRLGREDLVEQAYRRLSDLPDKQYRSVHAAYLFSEGKRDAGVKELEGLAQKDPKDRDTRTLLVSAYLLMNRVGDAEKLVNQALKANPNNTDALMQRSQILLRSGKQKEAEEDLARVLHIDPTLSLAHYVMAQIYGARGDALRQQEELGQAVRRSPSFLSARLALVRSLTLAKSPKPALDVLDEAPENQKTALAFIAERNLVLLAMNDTAGARNGISQGLALGRSPDLLMQDSVLKLIEKDYEGARASAEEALKRNPEDVRALRALAASYGAQKRPAEATRFLQAHAAAHPNSAGVQQLLGEWLLSIGQPVQARVAFTAAKAANPNLIAPSLALARLDLSEGKLVTARKTLTDILSSDSRNITARLLLGYLEEKDGNQAKAIEQLRKVLDTDPKNVAALNNLAYLLVDYAHQSDEALKYAQQAGELAPESADVAGTLGWVFYSKGLYDNAVTLLQKAVSQDGATATPNATIRKYHLGMAYLRRGDQARGRQLLETAVRLSPQLPAADSTQAAAVLKTLQ